MLSVGQKLWMVPYQRHLGVPMFVQVTKVGRKWAEISLRGYRISLNKLIIDGGGYTSPGRCYLTKEEHEAEVKLHAAWARLRSFMDRKHNPPDGVTIENIEAAIQVLGLPEPTSEA